MSGEPKTIEITYHLILQVILGTFVGNPYTSAINVGDFLTENTTLLDDSLLWYLWLGWKKLGYL